MSILLETLNGPLGWRWMRNRGRTRAFVSRLLQKKTHQRLHSFLNGGWQPSATASADRGFAVSLTSWTPRLQTLPLTLICLLDQKVAARGIYVWLAVKDLDRLSPPLLEAFSTHGVHFMTCDNLGPHTKWLPMLRMGYNETFVICDDDIFYPKNWLRKIVEEDCPNAYVGTRVHEIVTDSGNVLKYEKWKRDISWSGGASHLDFVTACGGAIIRPERISAKYCDWDRIKKYCPKADDIWLKAAHLEAGIPVYKTKYSFPCLEVPGTGESSLLGTNVDEGGNDKQLEILKQEWAKFHSQT